MRDLKNPEDRARWVRLGAVDTACAGWTCAPTSEDSEHRQHVRDAVAAIDFELSPAESAYIDVVRLAVAAQHPEAVALLLYTAEAAHAYLVHEQREHMLAKDHAGFSDIIEGVPMEDD